MLYFCLKKFFSECFLYLGRKIKMVVFDICCDRGKWCYCSMWDLFGWKGLMKEEIMFDENFIGWVGIVWVKG